MLTQRSNNLHFLPVNAPTTLLQLGEVIKLVLPLVLVRAYVLFLFLYCIFPEVKGQEDKSGRSRMPAAFAGITCTIVFLFILMLYFYMSGFVQF